MAARGAKAEQRVRDGEGGGMTLAAEGVSMTTRGRPKRKGAPRHPGGQINRREEARETAAAARERLYGMSRQVALTQEAGTVLGRLYKSRELSPHDPAQNRAMLEAGEWFRQVRADYERAIGAGRSVPSGSELERVRAYDGSDGTEPDYVERMQRARSRYADCRRALLECGEPLALFVAEAVICEEKAMPKHVGELRCALNALVRLHIAGRKVA